MFTFSDRRPPPRLETLPPELLDQVLGDLARSDISHLSRTCWGFHSVFLPRLLGPPENFNLAVKWAIQTGVNSLVDRVIADYGAPVSTVAMTDKSGDSVQVLSLSLAAMSGQAGTFRHLIELGAQVNCHPAAHASSIRTLVRLLAQSPSPDLLRIFLEINPSLVSQLSQAQRTELLFNAVDAASREKFPWPVSSCLGIAKMLLAAGADPDPGVVPMRYPVHGHDVIMPTLSAAIKSRSPELVRLLLENGARVSSMQDTFFRVKDEPPLEQASSPAEHYPADITISSPMCAVAYWLAQTLSTTEPSARAQDFQRLAEIGRLCLEHGAALNDCVSIFYDSRVLRFRTPMMLYVAMVKDWGLPGDHPESDAMQRLRYLCEIGAAGLRDTQHRFAYEIETHAGRVGPLLRRSAHEHWASALKRGRELWTSPVHLLLKIWVPRGSALPSLAQPVKLLMAQYGASEGLRLESGRGPSPACPFAAELLALYKYTPRVGEQPNNSTLDDTDPVMSAWESIVASVIQYLTSPELDNLLFDYCWFKLTCLSHYFKLYDKYFFVRRPKMDSECCSVATSADDPFTRPTIRQLIAAGADINRKLEGRWTTSLQEFGRWLMGSGGECHGQLWGGHRYVGPIGLSEERARLLRFLIDECGADPTTPFRDQTMAEILRQNLQEKGVGVDETTDSYRRLVEFDWGPWLLFGC
ncbi:hypothetical protein MAPG_07808 [Magnaporthiopsis poae ATCC 64411]|uniref:F-box domain-containing protein n=1 Tax=Magnaporthiopsis poae (strain ATCC 64411 / 73-15) TaxID=644358 RepID=A0A0C4E5N4_MAGP6|nr:hypothetical protein MAPG_07808 [Magnaporthiopsis poae ATCC 64411]